MGGFYLGPVYFTPLKLAASILGVLNFISLIIVVVYWSSDDPVVATPAPPPVYLPPVPEPEPEPEALVADVITAPTISWSTSSSRTDDAAGLTGTPTAGQTRTRVTNPSASAMACVEQFYSGADARNMTSVSVTLRDDFEAMFASGCSIIAGASHCGSEVLDEAGLIALLRAFPADVETRDLVLQGAAGPSGIVANHYRKTYTDGRRERHGAAVFKVDNGLIHQIIFYADLNSKAEEVRSFYTAIDNLVLTGDASMDTYVDRTLGDNGRYVAVFGAGLARVGLATRTNADANTMTLGELKTFVNAAGPRCSGGTCSGLLQRSIHGNGNTVVDYYTAAAGAASDPLDGVAVHNFNDDGLIQESYWYSQTADSLCNEGGKMLAAQQFFDGLDALTRQQAGETVAEMQTRVTTNYASVLSPLILTHQGSTGTNMFVAVFGPGTHTLGAIQVDTLRPKIYAEQCLVASTTGPAPAPSSFTGSSRAECLGDATIKDFRTLMIYGHRDATVGSMDRCAVGATNPSNCITRTLRPEGDVIAAHFTIHGADGGITDSGAVLLTFDNTFISQGYWYSDFESNLNAAGLCMVDQYVSGGACLPCAIGSTSNGATSSIYSGDTTCATTTG